MDSDLEFFRSIVGADHVLTGEEAAPWGEDATRRFEPRPRAVVLPGTTSEVSAILRQCHERAIPVVPSGGRTGLSGGAVAARGELVLSVSRMRAILSVEPEDRLLVCQAGAVTREVQESARAAGLELPVDFASSGSSQIGGNVATNAGGVRVIRYGSMRRWVAGLEVVLADGTVLGLEDACVKNNTGYDLKQLFIGSEGTLGVITKVALRLAGPPGERRVAVFGLSDVASAARLLAMARRHGVELSAFEFFPSPALEAVRSRLPALPAPLPSPHPVYALVEAEGEGADARARWEGFAEEALESGAAGDAAVAAGAEGARRLWALRENISESLSALGLVHKNDVAVPVSCVVRFCEELEALIAREYGGVRAVLYGHIGDGNIHVNLLQPPGIDRERFLALARESDPKVFSLVRRYGGSISAEHGVGLIKRDYLGYTRSEEEIAWMRRLKALFDPRGILNPGKLL